MANYPVRDPKAIVCGILTAICLMGICLLFTFGGTGFGREHPKVVNYANSMCHVESRSTKTYQCQSRYSTYTCYGPIWNVHHGEHQDIFAIVETEKRYLYFSEALYAAYKYDINSTYSCWYDMRNPSIAQWDQPSVRIAIILLCCGGLSVLLTIFFFWLDVKLAKQANLQMEYDNMDVYSNPNSYLKQ